MTDEPTLTPRTLTRWAVAIDGKVSLREEDLTAGEWELLYRRANAAGFPHDERDLSPVHCPICRNAFVTLAFLRWAPAGTVTIDQALEIVEGMPRDQVLDCIVVERVAAPGPGFPPESLDDAAVALPS